jgi:hypothetical protein
VCSGRDVPARLARVAAEGLDVGGERGVVLEQEPVLSPFATSTGMSMALSRWSLA